MQPEQALPLGFRWTPRAGGAEVLLAPGFEAEEVPAPDSGEMTRTGVARGPLRRLEVRGRGLWVRAYRHGGLFGPLLSDRFLTRRRGLEEILLLDHLSRGRVPAPRPAFLEIRYAGPFVRMRLGTWEIAGRPMTTAMAGEAAGRRSAMEAAGRAVRRLHDCGVLHGDLHLDNMLWDGETAGLLDFDRARRVGELSTGQRWHDLLRLLRSARKRRTHIACSSTDALRFLRAYSGGEAGWREELPDRMAAFERSVALHSLLWRRE
jgi:tRNA A-37 threonylcarbamoyl transferase component Bud32